MATLTKRELVVMISNETGLVQHQVFDVIQRTLDHLTDALAKGDNVELRNFGVFEVRLTKARVGRNPNKPGISKEPNAALPMPRLNLDKNRRRLIFNPCSRISFCMIMFL